MNNQYIEFLAKELIREKLVIFVGAGASMDSKLPSWNGLVRKFAKKLGMDKEWFTPEETLAIPEIYYKRFGKVPYYEILEEIFSKEYEPNPIHEALEKLGVIHLITTNFDTLIEEKVNENYDYDIIKKDEDLAHTSKRKMIIKMHGDLDNKNIILRKSEFEDYEDKFPLVSTFIKGLFTSNTILFIGYSLNDPNVKNIMSWIKSILKEDFRKVYLVEYDNDDIKTDCEEDQIINRIILPDLTKEEYSKKTRENLLEKKGELLKDFLEDLNKRREEKIKEEDIFIYSNLNYLTEVNLKELLTNCSINSFSIVNKGLLTQKELSYRGKKGNQNHIEQHKNILIKSDIQKINNDPIDKIFKNDQEFYDLLNKQEKYNELIELILQYDENSFENFLKENRWINDEYIFISGYIFFENYSLAKEKAENLLKQYQKENNKEKFIWTYHILDKIEYLEKHKNFDLTEKIINLKKIYNKYFKRKTKLYNEIIEWKTLEKVHKIMDVYLSETKNGKKTSYVGFTPLEKSIFLIRDIHKFNILNGVHFKSQELKNVIKKYVEILLIAYKNEMSIDEALFGKIISLEKFEYLDYYLMLQIEYKDLVNLFREYNIETLKCDEATIDTLLKTLKNILSLSSKENKNRFLNELKNIFVLVYKNDLTESQFNNFLEIFIAADRLDIFYLNNVFDREIQNFFNGILYKNEKYLSEEKLKIIILNIISNENNSNDVLVGSLTYYYSKALSKKLKITEEFNNFFNRNNLVIKLYFLRLFEDSVKKTEIKKIVEVLKDNFDLKIYNELLFLGYIEKNEELESKIIPYLDNIFKGKYQKNPSYNNILYLLYSLLERDNLSNSIKNNLKNYNNEVFRYYLESNNLQNGWEYYLNPETFDYSRFTIDDLKNFTEFGIKSILEKGNRNEKFMELIQEYLNSQNNNKIMSGFLNFSFENLENQSKEKTNKSRVRKKILKSLTQQKKLQN